MRSDEDLIRMHARLRKQAFEALREPLVEALRDAEPATDRERFVRQHHRTTEPT
jgi:hypothetical protein